MELAERSHNPQTSLRMQRNAEEVYVFIRTAS